MNNLVRLSEDGGIPELPILARTRSGVEFSPRAERWIYRDATATVNLDFSMWPATTEFAVSARHVFLWYAENMSPSHLRNMHERLTHFLRTACTWRDGSIEEITSKDLMNYRSALNRATSWYLGNLSGLLQKWGSLGYPGVSVDAILLLKQLRLQGNAKGEAILTHDPIRGPFTDIELESIHSALDVAYENGRVGREDYLLAYLYILLGQRNVQYAALKVRDVGIERSKDGSSITSRPTS